MVNRTRYRNELGQIDGGAIPTMVERYRKIGKLGQIDVFGQYAVFPTTGLVSYYKLDGNANDSFGSNTGTNTNVSWVSGKINNGGSFNGSSSRILVGAKQTGGLTISARINPANVVGEKHILTDWSYNYRNMLFSLSGSSIRAISGNGSTSNNADVTGGTVTAGIRQHCLVTRSGGTVTIYLNGTQVASGTGSHTGGATTNNQYIGVYPDLSGGYFNGLIDEVGIRNRALTQDEITTLYNNGAGLTYNP